MYIDFNLKFDKITNRMKKEYNDRFHRNTSTKNKFAFIALRGAVKALTFQKINLHQTIFVIPYIAYYSAKLKHCLFNLI